MKGTQSMQCSIDIQNTPNFAYMDFGHMGFFCDFLVIQTFPLINCSIWTILAGTNVVHISEDNYVKMLEQKERLQFQKVFTDIPAKRQ